MGPGHRSHLEVHDLSTRERRGQEATAVLVCSQCRRKGSPSLFKGVSCTVKTQKLHPKLLKFLAAVLAESPANREEIRNSLGLSDDELQLLRPVIRLRAVFKQSVAFNAAKALASGFGHRLTPLYPLTNSGHRSASKEVGTLAQSAGGSTLRGETRFGVSLAAGPSMQVLVRCVKETQKNLLLHAWATHRDVADKWFAHLGRKRKSCLAEECLARDTELSLPGDDSDVPRKSLYICCQHRWLFSVNLNKRTNCTGEDARIGGYRGVRVGEASLPGPRARKKTKQLPESLLLWTCNTAGAKQAWSCCCKKPRLLLMNGLHSVTMLSAMDTLLISPVPGKRR